MVETENRTRKVQNDMAAYGGEFESYLISALNDSLLKKSKFDSETLTVPVSNDYPFSSDQIKNLQFTSWYIENGEKNLITVVFNLDGNPHEIIIRDTKYYVKEIYSADKRNTQQLSVSHSDFLTTNLL